MTADPSVVLVTGGTGRLGRVLTPLLAASGYAVRVPSRTASPGVDLVSGTGVTEAVRHSDVIVHLATSNGRGDVAMMRNLLTALHAATQESGRRPHLVYLSIVGCDEVPLPYYRHKTAAEQLALGSGLPVTVLRSTQFHSLVAQIFGSQRRLPALLVPDIPMQPIDLGDVAARVVELVGAPAAGRVADIGGPETAPLPDFARQWLQGHGGRVRVLPVRLPGRTFAAYREGSHTVPDTAYGRTTFRESYFRPGQVRPGD